MQEAYQLVQEKVQQKKKMAEEQWRRNHVIATGLKPGDKVLLKNIKKFEGPDKLRGYWDEEIYVVKKVGGNGGVVYTTQYVKKMTPSQAERFIAT